jgi:uncharacterized protein
MLASAQHDDLDRGPSGSGQERFCALTRIARPVDDLIRFVVAPDGEVVPDLKRKLPGRGLWLTATRQTVSEAIKRNVFARGFKRDVKAAPDLPDKTADLLLRAALDALAIVGKAGQVVAGFAKVEAAIGGGEVIALIEASDGAEDGKRKLAAVQRRKPAETGREIPVIAIFSANQLDLALNRLNVIHAALLAGPVSDTFLARTKRFERFTTGILTNSAPTTGAPSETLTAPVDVKVDQGRQEN